MSHFDAKFLDSDSDGVALLAAVLHAVPDAKPAERGPDRQRMTRSGSFTQAFASPLRTGRATRRTVKLS